MDRLGFLPRKATIWRQNLVFRFEQTVISRHENDNFMCSAARSQPSQPHFQAIGFEIHEYPLNSSVSVPQQAHACDRSGGEIMAGEVGLDIDTIFRVIKGSLPEYGAALVKECGSVYVFDLKTESGSIQYTLDLSQGQGNVEKGPRAGANSVIKTTEQHLIDFFLGRVSFRELFSSGRLRVDGSTGRATRLRLSSFPPFTPDSVRKYAAPRL